ncbi:MAG: hypothetical protein ABJA89_06115 [Lapillicoccus sp.]
MGAAGGLGGYFPPLIMGATYQRVFSGYGFGLSLLVILVLVARGALASPTSVSGPPGRLSPGDGRPGVPGVPG